MMITRQVRCKKCGKMFPLTYPEKLSDIGRDVISYCPPCLHTEILKNERSTHNDHLCRAFEERYGTRPNMSQSALSEQAGASKAAISQYLSGKNTPGPDRIKALADATGVSFDYLMGYGAAPVAEPPIKKISVKEAARCMGKSDQFVRIGLQRGLLPFGNAVPGTGACWNYYINPTKFRDYVGADQFNSFFGLTA